MTREELLKLIGTKPASKTAAAVSKVDWSKPPVVVGPSKTTHDSVLKLDEWDRAQGERLARRPPIKEPAAMADFLAAAFKPDPEKNEGGCFDALRQRFLDLLTGTPEHAALRTATVLDVAASEAAAVKFAEAFSKLRAEEETKADARKSEGRLLRAVSKALKEATEEVEEMAEARHAVGGMGIGAAGSPMDPTMVGRLFERIKNDPKLRRIFERTGRFRLMAQAKQRTKVTHGVDDVVGVELGGEIARLVPTELAMLADPDFELDAMRRLVEKQSMQRQHRGTERVGKGPVLIVVDESGSMEGEPIERAKAFALAMAYIGRHQRRWVGLISYSGDSGHRLLALPPTRWNEDALLDWLKAFIGRGSHLDVPIREMPEYLKRIGAPQGKTDVIFVTDAILRIPIEMQKTFLDWKAKEKVRVISLVIQSGWKGGCGDLEKVSDETHAVGSIDVGEAGVESCLSI